jgi:ubiquinone/menaquinone biosynthesis C-methylase UbiE
MSDGAMYLVDGRPLSADQCRALFARSAASDRHRKVLERVEGDTIVDVGCYTGAFVHAAARRLADRTVIGVDYSEDNIRIARLLYPELHERFRRMSAYQLDFADSSIDCVTLQEVLEHLEGAALAVKEANRVLRPGGVLIVSVPNPFYVRSIATFVGNEIRNAFRRWRGQPPSLATQVFTRTLEWDRHICAWTPETLLTLLTVNGFDYVDHCYENGIRNPLGRLIVAALPFLGPTQILKVRKVAASGRLV